MRALVIGGGGREHALTWKLGQEVEVMASPGNPGMDCEKFDVAATDLAGIESLCRRLRPDLVVIGPEDPLVLGLGDRLRTAGFTVFGPGASGAQLEASKAFSKAMMTQAGIPTAASGIFTDPEAAHAYCAARFDAGIQVVVKASGNALGKGVVVCPSRDEADEAISEMMIEGIFGDGGRTLVIEDRLAGREFSLLTIVSDGQHFSLPVAQDYKRILDGDRGPNTGGMGSYSPCNWLTSDLIAKAEDRIVVPAIAQMKSQGIAYRGVLFSGVMVVGGEPICLEFNVRFGDPEAQTIVRRLGTGFAELLAAAAKGEPLPRLATLAHAAVTVVVASGGYPGSFRKGIPIALGPMPEDAVVFHAGTTDKGGALRTHGGRVIGVSAIGADLADARSKAYQGVAQVHFDGAHWRKDIASGKDGP